MSHFSYSGSTSRRHESHSTSLAQDSRRRRRRANRRGILNESYKYAPLDDDSLVIRLLERDAEGKWQLTPCTLDAAPPYHALSYTWGSTWDQDTILMNAEELQIPGTVKRFLDAQMERRRWWIDQISINQHDTAELNRQVLSMASIYHKAQKVVVWLDGLTQPTCEVLNVELYELAIAKTEVNERRKKLLIDAAAEICDHRYWTRVWILQEVAFAKALEISYHDGHVTWSQMLELLARCDGLGWKPPHRLGWFTKYVTSLSKESIEGTWRLDELVVELRDSQCKNPKDKIYGIQGLLHPRHRLAVNYDQPPEAVYLEAVGIMIDEWPEDRSLEQLISICFRLGVQMLPEALGLHNVFYRMDPFMEILLIEDEPSLEGFVRGLFSAGDTSSSHRRLRDKQKAQLAVAFRNLVESLEENLLP